MQLITWVNSAITSKSFEDGRTFFLEACFSFMAILSLCGKSAGN
jgi:hypothetical protein